MSELRLPGGVSDLVARRLRRIHERVATATEEQAPTALAELAIHYDRGGRNEKAFEYAMLAADRARGTNAHDEGIRFLRIAERNTTTPTQLAEVHERLAELAEAAAQYDEALESCDQAVAHFTAAGDRRRALAVGALRERVRALLGQSANMTLGACLTMDEEAKGHGWHRERTSLLTLISTTYFRLGDGQAAERAARECVRAAEALDDVKPLAQAFLRLGFAVQESSPQEAIELYRQSLSLFEREGDYAGQARAHNNMGIVFTRRGDWRGGESSFKTAIAHARTVRMPDLWGLAALNLGVLHLKRGAIDEARELLGEALALFAAVRNMERQLYAIFNLAHLDRARGEHDAAAELYDVAATIARRIAHSDVEIGAMAGSGLSHIARGNLSAAYAALTGAEERMRPRTDWFQGRELVEALRVLCYAADGRAAEAKSHLEWSLSLIDGRDGYGAASLVADCAPALRLYDQAFVSRLLTQFEPRVSRLGFEGLTRLHKKLRAEA